MNESVANLSPEQLRRAADVAEQIESLRNELSNILGAGVGQIGSGSSRRQKRKISAAGIARIRAAQKARWAKAKRTDAWGTAKPKRRVSAAVKARLSAIAKARWKKAKAAGKTAL
jgi:hypothetical protein